MNSALLNVFVFLLLADIADMTAFALHFTCFNTSYNTTTQRRPVWTKFILHRKLSVTLASLLTANYSLKLRRGEAFMHTSNTDCSAVLHTYWFQVTSALIYTSGRVFTNWWRDVRFAICTVICWHLSLKERVLLSWKS